MKQRKSANYLLISSAHIGMSDDILAIYSQVSKFYGTKVIHLGPLATDEEIKKNTRLTAAAARLEDLYEAASTERQEDAARAKLDRVEEEIKELKTAQAERVARLNKAFGKVTFVTTDDMVIPGKIDGAVVRGGMELSRYLFLSPVPPRTMRATGGGITQASVAYLTELGKSWIVAHPIPETQCFPKPGLNEAYNYFTVGALKHAAIPTHTKNQYEFAHMPCAVLVIMDKDSGEFHATQLHLDYLRDESNSRLGAMVLHDGVMFNDKGCTEVDEDDRASFGTDYHAPFQHPGVVASHRAINVMFQPGTLIDGGDMGSFESVSHWLEGKPGDSEGLRLADDLIALRRLMDSLANVKSIKRKVLIDSNHHEWLSEFVSKNHVLKGMVDWPTLARDMFADWEVIIREAGDNNVFKFGDLTIRHGDKDQGVKGKFKYVKYLCGHFHRFVTWRRSIGLGCGAKLGPKYTGNDVNAWQSQIATITRYKGVTAVAPKIVLHDKAKKVSRFSYRDKIFEVDEYVAKS